MRVNYVIVSVSDMRRSVAFYRDVLALPLRFESPGWTEFATEGTTLALHVATGADAPPHAPATVAPSRCRPGFGVADLDAFHLRMIASNVVCVEEPKEVFGSRVAQYLDPDGLPISVGEERRPR